MSAETEAGAAQQWLALIAVAEEPARALLVLGGHCRLARCDVEDVGAPAPAPALPVGLAEGAGAASDFTGEAGAALPPPLVLSGHVASLTPY